MARARKATPARRSTVKSREALQATFEGIVDNIGRVIKGKDDMIRLTLTAILANGHVLFEDLPGTGKTMLARSFGRTIDASNNRIQCTPDLLPSDITGSPVLDRRTGDFVFRPGPVFANILLADEINRASPKTQSALLESMEERQVSVDATTYKLPRPFMVIATQNPVELEGTYPLPEAQLDRFLLRLRIGYPDRDAEIAILDAQGVDPIDPDALEPVTDAETVAVWIHELGRIHVSPELQGYIVDLVEATRHHRDLMLGVSPRGALALQRASRALAASIGRSYVVADDVKVLASAVLEHRLLLSSEAMMRAVNPADVLSAILDSVPVPANRAG
jgi:MoxR-like ATPase